nr:plasmid partition protein ParG [Phormidium tenue]
MPDVQTSEHPDTQASKQPDISTSKAKSSSSDYKRTTVYLTQELHRRLKRASLDEGMEMSDIAESAIAAWLEEHSDV